MRRACVLVVFAVVVRALRSDDEMRSASIALGQWQADGVCGSVLPRKRVAVLIAGLVRTLGLAHVHRSIGQYGIDAMGADATVFMELKTNGTGRLGREAGGVDAAASAAVEYLRPASVRWNAVDGELHAAMRSCGPVPATDATTHWIVSQWLGVRNAFVAMLRHERSSGVAFDAVVKLRTDDLWLGPAPYWCALSGLWASPPHAYANLAGSDRADYVGGLDWWLAVPRSHAESVFLMADAYLDCNKSNPQHSEKWLSQTLKAAGLAVTRLRHMPRVIVYEERQTAKKFCGYVPEYLGADGACGRLRYPRHLAQ